MKIIFMGTPDISAKSLEEISKTKHEIIGVVTNPDKQKGRGMKLIYSPVKEIALEKGYKIFQPEKVKNNTEFINEIKELNPDLIVVVAYGKILPKEILDIPQKGCINLHVSKLPKYRGPAPIQWAILNGDKKTGITTMYMAEGMDTGDIIECQDVDISENETTGELWEEVSQKGAKLLVHTIQLIEENKQTKTKQNEEEASYAPMLEKSIAEIKWEEYTTSKIHNLIRGLNPIMGAYTYINGKKLKIWKSEIIDLQEFKNTYPNIEINKKPGEIILANNKQGLYIKTKDGIIKALEVQAENSKRLSTHDYLLGNKI